MSTVVATLRQLAYQHGERIAVTVLDGGEGDGTHWTYADLDARARAVAAELTQMGLRQQRVVLMLPTSHEFVSAFFGCLYAGAIAVPLPPLRPGRPKTLLYGVLKDAQPKLVLTAPRLVRELADDPLLGGVHVKSVVDLPYGGAMSVDVAPSDIAYLQYTSGSTRIPRGVVVQHGQILTHVRMSWRTFELDDESVCASWLPMFHDMGLAGMLMTPLSHGVRTILMDSSYFVQKPLRWLTCMSRHRATTTGAPNFAYDLCVDRISLEQRAGLQLDGWTTAFNGAEPVRAKTIERFTKAFAPYGFRRETFYPCYGLAEATLLVTGGRRKAPPVVRRFRSNALERGEVEEAEDQNATLTLVGCGARQKEQRVEIIDPQSLASSRVGEIWVKGEGTAAAYWNASQTTQDVFAARTSDGSGPYLRTGDLGFWHDGELFVIGRLDDRLIVHGQNYYAHDLEYAVRTKNPALASTQSALFTINRDDGTKLVAIQELPRGWNEARAHELVPMIREAIADEFQLGVDTIVVVGRGQIPRTSSGKLQRNRIKKSFEDGSLSVIHRVDPTEPQPAMQVRLAKRVDPTSLRKAVRRLVAVKLDVPESAVDPEATFTACGLTSLQLAGLSGEIGELIGRDVQAFDLYAHPSIARLCRHLTVVEPPAQLEAQPDGQESIAIVGLACRFPGARNSDELWNLLLEGRDAIREIPADRWDWTTVHDPSAERPGTTNSRWGGFLDRVDTFDAAFFGISTREADSMDPQQRLLLETAWDAMEDAGLTRGRLAATKTGVFVGIATNDYTRRLGRAGALNDLYWCTSNALSVAANRISYVLDLRGPSVAVDTACSSSLVAVHLACQSLRRGESQVAFAGGVNVILMPDVTINMSQAGVTAADGRCKAFDARADGLVRSEGVGVVVLKPLSRALADHDRIYAVIRGTAVNHNGATNGITSPNPRAQVDVLRAAYRDAGVDPTTVEYVEAHGPGTVLGDPIELGALAEVTGGSARSAPCLVGSIKTNVGHLEAAAGIAGLIKVALSIHHGLIPPSLHFEQPNPAVPFDDWRLKVPVKTEHWREVRRAAVSAFGFGGTNAHAILEGVERATSAASEAPISDDALVVPLSAPNDDALIGVAGAWQSWLESPNAGIECLRNVAFSAGHHRTHHKMRLAIVARRPEELSQRLAEFRRAETGRWMARAEALTCVDNAPVFVFAGHEKVSEAGLGRLMRYADFREAIHACDAQTSARFGWQVSQLLTEPMRVEESLLAQQIALFTLQYALTSLWVSWGVKPGAAIGHSAGEVVAACVAGALTLSEAVTVMGERCRRLAASVEAAETGRMAAVRLPVEALAAKLASFDGKVEIAAHNAPSVTICAGVAEDLVRLLQELGRNVHSQLLDVPGPGHTSFVAPAAEALERALVEINPRRAELPVYSTVDGVNVPERVFGAAHWSKHVRSAVLFREAVDAAIEAGHRVFLEVGAQATLFAGIAGTLFTRRTRGYAIPSLRPQQDADESLFSAVAQLYVAGVEPDWEALYPQARAHALPRYPWQRQRHWINPPVAPALVMPAASTSLLGQRLEVASDSAYWESTVQHSQFPWLRDHEVDGSALFPATGYLAMAMEAARARLGDVVMITDVLLHSPLFIGPQQAHRLQTRLARGACGWSCEILARNTYASENPWTLLASCHVRSAAEQPYDALPNSTATPKTQVNSAHLYERFAEHGITYGPHFRRIERLHCDETEAVAEVNASTPAATSTALDPGVLDACLQPFGATAFALLATGAPAMLPARIESVRLFGSWSQRVTSRVRRRLGSLQNDVGADVVVSAEDGRAIAEVRGLYVEPIGARARTLREDTLIDVQWRGATCERVPVSGVWAIWGGSASLRGALERQMTAAGAHVELLGAMQEGNLERWLMQRPEAHGILDLSPTTHGIVDDMSGGALLQDLGNLARPTLDAIRTIIKRNSSTRYWLVTRGGVAVAATEVPDPGQHALWALGRTIGTEHPKTFGGLVDVDPADDDEAAARALVASIGQSAEDQLAWRMGRAHAARLSVAAAPARPPRMQIDSDGTYLVTGGFGDLGLIIARWLVGQGARRLVLMGRLGLPPRERWRSQQDGHVAKRVRAVRELEALGASVHPAEVDVSKQAELERWLDEFDACAWPRIRGVLHLAGIVYGVPVEQLDDAALVTHLGPKASGAWNLSRYFAARNLDFFVLFSSGAAVLGSPGLAAYATANAFMDALAMKCRAHGMPATSIAWGLWAEAGMAARLLRSAPQRISPRGMKSIRNHEALEWLKRLAGNDRAYAVVMPIDWAEWASVHMDAAKRPYVSELVQAGSRPERVLLDLDRAALLAQPMTERTASLMALLRSHLASILEVPLELLEVDRPLSQVGLDSLMAVEVRNRVEEKLGVTIPIANLMQGASISSLSSFVSQRMGSLPPAACTEVKAFEPGEAHALLGRLHELADEQVSALLDSFEDVSQRRLGYRGAQAEYCTTQAVSAVRFRKPHGDILL